MQFLTYGDLLQIYTALAYLAINAILYDLHCVTAN